MTTCETCGAAVSMEHQEGGTKEGEFREEYTCAQGHQGVIKGEASDSPSEWWKTGAVFNDYNEVTV